MNNQLPKEFEEFSEARRNGFIKVKNFKDKGYNVVGTFCTFTPWELVEAAGAIGISVCSVSDETTEEAEAHLPKNLCPLIKSSYGFALTNKCPYIYFSDLILGETTCDGKKKMFELLGEIKNTHIMQLPPSNQGEASFNMWKAEMIKVKERLEKDFNVEITEEKIKEAIKIKNEERKAAEEFYALGKLCPPPIWGYDMQKVLEGIAYTMDRREGIQNLRNLTEKIRKEYEAGKKPVPENAPRILITGCPSGGVADKVVKTIEDNGAVVVCYENCGGVKEKRKLVREDIDPIDALTEKYLSIPCSVMSPNDGRMDLLKELIEEYNVQGVIDITLQACHTYAIETFNVKNTVNKKDIPYLNIETNYSESDIGQLKTRIAAFIEML